MNQRETQQRIASALCRNITVQYNVASLAFKDAGEQTTLAMSVAMLGVAATCLTASKATPNSPPTSDQLLFTCLLIHNSVEFQGDTLAVEFAWDHVQKTIDQFRDITGRSCEETLNPSLLEALADWKKKNDVLLPESLKQFRPQ